jgi:hypothetical protein
MDTISFIDSRVAVSHGDTVLTGKVAPEQSASFSYERQALSIFDNDLRWTLRARRVPRKNCALSR